jgi:hypothetical protein
LVEAFFILAPSYVSCLAIYWSNTAEKCRKLQEALYIQRVIAHSSWPVSTQLTWQALEGFNKRDL